MKTEREVIIDHKTTIITKSIEPDDIVRAKYLEKLNSRGLREINGNSMGRPLMLVPKK